MITGPTLMDLYIAVRIMIIKHGRDAAWGVLEADEAENEPEDIIYVKRPGDISTRGYIRKAPTSYTYKPRTKDITPRSDK